MSTARNGSTRAWRRARAAVLRQESTCALCGAVVDKTLPARNPDGTVNLMSASVDHADAVAAGGALLSRSNLQLSHLGCNMRKGDGRKRDPLNTTRAW